MPPERYRTISIREELYNELKEEYERVTKDKRVKLKFSAWLSEFIWEYLERAQTVKPH